MKAKYEADAAVERYLGLNLNPKFSSIDQCNYYVEACKELAFILRHAYSESPKCLQSLIFEDILAVFRLLPQFPVQMQNAILAADTLLQTIEYVIPKKKKVLAVAAYKHAMVTWKRRVKFRGEEQGQGVTQLPEDVIQLVFSHLDLRSLAYASMVCRSWREAAGENHLWNLLYFNFFGDLETCLSYGILRRGGIKSEGTAANALENGIVNPNNIDWREAFQEMYRGLGSKRYLHYRGYCKTCNLIVWLNDAKCYRNHRGIGTLHCKIDPISMDQIVEYLLYGNLPSDCSSDSDSEDNSVLRLWDLERLFRTVLNSEENLYLS